MARQSIESDRLHLLSEEHNIPPSAFTSQAPSVLSRASSQATLKANETASAASLSPTVSAPPLTASATAARRFTKSEEEYLAALRAWVEEKQYISLGPSTTLEGFYGKKTMDMYAAKESKRGKGKGSKNQITTADLDVNGRRKTIAALGSSRIEEEQTSDVRRKSIRNWLGKR